MSQNGWFQSGADLMRQWFEFTSKTMEAAAVPWQGASASAPDAARQFRGEMLKAWGEYCEQFMRSPVFLDWLKRLVHSNLQARKQMGDMLGEAHFVMQTASRQDVDELMRAVQRVEDAVARLTVQVEELRDRFESSEDDPPPAEAAVQRGAAAPDLNGRPARPRRPAKRRHNT